MQESIEVKEKYSNNWKPTLYASLLISLSTFMIFLYLDDVLWAGIFRLVAFISLSLGIFCMLKVMEGVKTFGVEVRDGLLLISYLKNDEVISKDKLQVGDIQSIYAEPYHFKFPFTDFRFELSGNQNFIIAFENEEESDMPLFTFGGRVLTVDKESGQKLMLFLEQHGLYTQIN